MFSAINEELKSNMQRSVDFFKDELSTIRAGRANPRILDKVMVEYYGTETPITQTSNISTPEPRLIQVKPFDVNTLADIEKAINAANLGFNATNDGKVIRIAMPVLTEERRKELVKQVKAMGEEAKVAIRNQRRTAIDEVKKLEKENDMTEDDLKRAEKDIQKMTDDFGKKVDELLEQKEKEILEI